MVKQQKFPMVVKRGSASVAIYQNKSKRGYSSYLVRYFRGTEVVRITRAKYEDALNEAESAALILANGELDVLTLRSDDRRSYIQALKNLNATGVGLETATREYAEALAILRGTSLLDAVRDHVRCQPQFCEPKKVAEIVEELLKQKIEKGRDKTYIKDLRIRLNPFAKSFQCPIASVSTALIEEFLIKQKVSGRSQNNSRRIIGTLFRFAVKRGYLPKDHPGVTGVERATEHPHEIEIFLPDEMARLLKAAAPKIIAFLALGGFAGLRHAEIMRLDWEDVKLEEGHIEIKAATSKTRVRRLITIQANLRAWLIPHHAGRGAVAAFANMTKQLLWLAEDANVAWKHNALRHSYVSYRVAQTSDIPRVSYEAGNSPRIIERNYLKRVTPDQAQLWFSITPSREPNILTLRQAISAG